MTYRPTTLLLLLLAMCASHAGAQSPPRGGASAPDSATTADSLTVSPRGALLRSFAIPGWGQAYAGAPGRGTIYFGLEAGSLWMVFKTRQQLAASRVRDRALRERDQLDQGQISPLTRSRAQQFEDWITLAVFVALFSGADAYVTAQLSDFATFVNVRPGMEGTLEIRGDVPLPRR